MKIVTFNLRYQNPRDGIHSFRHRALPILEKIASEQPDVIGFQECLPEMMRFLKEHMKGYGIAGCGRSTDYGGEYNPVAWRDDRYELIGLETRWLSPTPEIPGSRFEEQSPCPRILTRVLLRPWASAKPFCVINTHLDHESVTARVLGAGQVCACAKELDPSVPILITGDMNAEPEEASIRTFLDPGLGLRDETEGIGATFHGWDGSSALKIDYIFSRGFRTAAPCIKWDERDEGGLWLSDHTPVACSLEPV